MCKDLSGEMSVSENPEKAGNVWECSHITVQVWLWLKEGSENWCSIKKKMKLLGNPQAKDRHQGHWVFPGMSVP